MAKKKPRRWRLFCCYQEEGREAKAVDLIRQMKDRGFKAKILITRPEHYSSGHTHVAVLCTLEEKLQLAGILPFRQGLDLMVKELAKFDQLEIEA